jgi:hypothetical protein
MNTQTDPDISTRVFTRFFRVLWFSARLLGFTTEARFTYLSAHLDILSLRRSRPPFYHPFATLLQFRTTNQLLVTLYKGRCFHSCPLFLRPFPRLCRGLIRLSVLFCVFQVSTFFLFAVFALLCWRRMGFIALQ